MKDFFIYIQPVDQHCSRWIRASTIHQVIPCDAGSCHIRMDQHLITNFKINETADSFLHRLENGHQIRLIDCQQCKKPNQANVLAPICHNCRAKNSIRTNEEALNQILPPLSSPPTQQYVKPGEDPRMV